MAAIPEEPSFADLYDDTSPPASTPVASAEVVDLTAGFVHRAQGEPSSVRFARKKLAESGLTPETFPMQYGKPGKYDGLPHFTIVFPDSPTGYSIDRIERDENKYHFPADKPVETYWPNGKKSQARYANEAYTAMAEGQIKAFAAEKYLHVPTAGINGCSGWGEKLRAVSKTANHTTVRTALLPGLGQGKFHLVLMDGDWAKNTDVEKALGTYCTEVAKTGAEPIVPDFGYDEGDNRLAVDEWIVKEFGSVPDKIPAPDVVLRRLLALPRVPWTQLRVMDSFYSSDLERFNRGYIDFTDRGNATFLSRLYGPGNLRYLTDTKEWACFGDELTGDDLEVKSSKTWKLYPEKALELVNPAALQRKHHADRLYQQVHELAEFAKSGFQTKPPDPAMIEAMEKEAGLLFKSYLALSENRTRLAVLTDLMTREDIRATRSDFDSKVDLLNTPDGVIELETGVIRPAKRDDCVLNCTAVGYTGIDPTLHPDPAIAADAKKMKRGLEEALSAAHGVPDPEMVRYHCRRMGASLRAECSLTALETMFGPGSTAKSSLLMTLDSALANYSAVVPAGVLLSSYANRDPEGATPFAMLLVSKRIGIISETKDTAVLDDAKLKMFTGGDVLALRGNYRDGGNYVFTATPVLITNTMPASKVLDSALVDRMAITPFRCRWNRPDKIIMSVGDEDLPQADKWFINEAKHSIGARMWLLWAYVQGGVEYASEERDAAGLVTKQKYTVGIRPQAVIDTVSTYITEQDEIAQFFSESQWRLHAAGDGDRDRHKVLSGIVYASYSDFIRGRGGMPPNSSVFSKRVKDRFPQIDIHRIGGKSYMWGVVRRTDAEVRSDVGSTHRVGAGD